MLHAKFLDRRTSGSGEYFTEFYHIWAWRPPWSDDFDYIYINVCFPFPKSLHMKFGFDWSSGLRGEK